MRTEMKNLIACLLGIILILQSSGLSVARAADKDKDEDRLKDCGTVVKEILDIPDNIPQDLGRPRRFGRDRRDLALRDFELFPFPWPLCRNLSGRLNHPTRQQSKRANLWKKAGG